MKNYLGLLSVTICLLLVACSGRHREDEQGDLPSPTPIPSATPTPSSKPVTNTDTVNTETPTPEANTPATTPTPPPTTMPFPTGIVIPGKKGFVKSPYNPTGPDVDVHDFAPGTPVRCPFTNKIFIVPQE